MKDLRKLLCVGLLVFVQLHLDRGVAALLKADAIVENNYIVAAVAVQIGKRLFQLVHRGFVEAFLALEKAFLVAALFDEVQLKAQ